VWFALNRHLTAFSAPIGGILIAGGIFSLAVGVRILPYTLIGLIVLIGAAGFTPFLTAFVYFRSGVRAFKANLLQRYYAELTGEDIEFKVRVMDD
jgi:hypothetical protein